MLDRDHFAADIACIWSMARVIECNLRSRPNHKAYEAIDELAELMIGIDQLIKKWEDKVGSWRVSIGDSDDILTKDNDRY